MRTLLVIFALTLVFGCNGKDQAKKEAETAKPYVPPPFEPEIDPADAALQRREVDEKSLFECIFTCAGAGKQAKHPPRDLRARCVATCTEQCITTCVDRAEVRKETTETTRKDCAASCRLNN